MLRKEVKILEQIPKRSNHFTVFDILARLAFSKEHPLTATAFRAYYIFFQVTVYS